MSVPGVVLVLFGAMVSRIAWIEWHESDSDWFLNLFLTIVAVGLIVLGAFT